MSLRREYKAFMRSTEWRELRARKLEAAKGLCEVCRDARATEVHHKNYERFGGGERMDDLQAACKDCHKRIHKIAKDHGGMWFSTRTAAQHAQTQYGVDIRADLLASYDR